MTAFASTDVTITLAANDINIMPGSMKTVCLPTIAFGDGSLTYATGGVPLPVIGQFGMKRELQRLRIDQPAANGFEYRYDKDEHKIKIYCQGFTTSSTAAAANENGALVENCLSVEGVPRIPNTVADTTYDMGQRIEVPNGTALAAVTLLCEAIGE
jgi:hypothetical protein